MLRISQKYSSDPKCVDESFPLPNKTKMWMILNMRSLQRLESDSMMLRQFSILLVINSLCRNLLCIHDYQNLRSHHINNKLSHPNIYFRSNCSHPQLAGPEEMQGSPNCKKNVVLDTAFCCNANDPASSLSQVQICSGYGEGFGFACAACVRNAADQSAPRPIGR